MANPRHSPNLAVKKHILPRNCGIHPETCARTGVDPFNAQNSALKISLQGYSESKLENPMGFEKAKPPVGLQPVQGRSPSCRACPRCRTPVPFPAPEIGAEAYMNKCPPTATTTRRKRCCYALILLVTHGPGPCFNEPAAVHHQRALAEKKLDAALEQNVQDPVLGHLQRNMEKQYMKLWWLDAPHSSHSRPHGSMATGDRHGCIRQNMICRFFGPLRGWTPSNQLN